MKAKQTLIRNSALVLAGMVVAACALQRADTATKAQATMVGMFKEKVVSCMGVPASSYRVGSTEVLSYASGDGRTDRVGVVDVFGGYNYATGIGVSTTTTKYCKIDIVLVGGQVNRVNYTGPTGDLFTQGEQCAYAVNNCVAQTASLPYSQAPASTVPQSYTVPPAPIAAVSEAQSPVLTAPQSYIALPPPDTAVSEKQAPPSVPQKLQRYDELKRQNGLAKR